MAKFLSLWCMSPTAPWYTDPAEVVKSCEMNFAAVDDTIKTGEAKEFGFPDGRLGYVKTEGDSKYI